MKRPRLFLTILTSLWFYFAIGQIGLVTHTPEAYEGYTLFHPLNYTSTFLIDNEGYVIHEWQSEYPPGNAVYLLENGDLLRSQEPDLNNLAIGGGGGILEIVDWDGESKWRMELFEGDERFHHDMKLLANGNILAIALERIGTDEALAAGRNPDRLVGGEIWSEKILEIKPVGSDDFEIVWEWRAFDHIIQDFDPEKPNYGTVADHPEKIDLNYVTDLTTPDWIHFNSIDYNPTLDQIVLSTPFWSEVWIIDHSTSTAEAATGSGGDFNKGGDLLFRWGNDSTFNKEDVSDQKLFFQHNAQWVARDASNWDILLYNNGRGRTATSETDYSTIDRIQLTIDDENKRYNVSQDGIFLPTDITNIYTAPEDPTNFYSRFLSGVQLLPNGHMLICEGATGRFFELDAAQKIVWTYVNPVNVELLCDTTEQAGGVAFRAEKYDIAYPGILNDERKDLLSKRGCEIPLAVNSQTRRSYRLQPNGDVVFNDPENMHSVQVYSLTGQLLVSQDFTRSRKRLSLSPFKNQLILLEVRTSQGTYQEKIFYGSR